MAFVLVHNHSLLLYFLTLHWFLLVAVLGDLHLDGLVAVGADWTFILEAVHTEWFFVLLAYEILDFDQIGLAAEFAYLMRFALRVLDMFDFAWIAKEHRVAGQTLELRSILRINHVRWAQMA